MKALASAILVLASAGFAFAGATVPAFRTGLGVALPYAAMLIFSVGIAYRVIRWAGAPVPFRIPVTCGQEKSLPWLKSNRIDNPFTRVGAFARVALEVLCFRSLFRNTQAELRQGPRLLYAENKFLWLAALAFHWSLLVVLIRHLRFFVQPVPRFVVVLDSLDRFLQVGAPGLLVSDIVILAGLLFLLARRFTNAQVRTISLDTDYFALFLLLGIACSGILMRYFTRIDLERVKEFALGLVTFSPVLPVELSPLVFVHVALVSVLLMYFPFSKLVHMGGIFLSPTRNLPNDSRARRHVNPWDYPVKVHTYREWEEEFHDKIKAAGLPLESKDA